MSKIKIDVIIIGILLLFTIYLSFNHSFLAIGYPIIPKYVFISPNLIIHSPNTFAIVGSQLTNISYINKQLNITATTIIAPQNQTQHTNTTAVNTQCANFGFDNTTSLFVLRGIPKIIKNSSYKVMFKYTPSKIGTYAFGVICETSHTNYSIATNKWSKWSKQKISSNKIYLVKIVKTATTSTAPSFSFNNIINQIVNYIMNLFKYFNI